MKLQFKLAVITTGVIVALASGAGVQFQPDPKSEESEALMALEPIRLATFAECNNARGEKFLFTKVLAPASGRVAGYYQLSLVPTPNGDYVSKIVTAAVHLSDADLRNGIDARYQVDLYVPSYRMYDVATGKWSEWTSEHSLGNSVHYGSFTVIKRNGKWVVDGGYQIHTNGKLQPANCSELPVG